MRHSVGTWRGTERMTRDPADPLGVRADGRNPPGRFAGDYENDELILEGEGHGMRLRHRTSRPDPDTMRTVSEISSDGRSWTVVFDGTNQRVP
ncbi:MAG TPA: hypothetical protein VK837_02750 [Longimicrobiales bacterium]|nr:hypothetical protein [Longimicrobiales bacterium]